MKSTFIRNGLILGALSIIIFLIVRFTFYNDFLLASGFVNIVIFPTLSVAFAAISTWRFSKTKYEVNFRETFSAAYITQMIAGAFFMVFIYFFFNWFHPESIEPIRNGLIENQKNNTNITEEDRQFFIEGYKSDYLLSARFLFLVFLVPIMLPFYGLTSLIMALFFRNK